MATLFDRLIGRPQQIVPMSERDYIATAENGYNKPLIEQVDFMNENQNAFDDLTRQQWNNAGGYETIRNNALMGNTSGIQSLDNFMDNAGLERNVLTSGLETIPEQRGFLSDLVKGYQENYSTPFSINNLQQNQNKGVASRIGEGLGTLARGLNSPFGKAVLAYGATRALGGDNTLAAMQGLTAGVTNQALRTQDALYRKGLEEQGIDTSKIRGWITDDVYKNYSNSYYKMRDLARREAATDAQIELTNLKAEAQAIKNSTLPEMQKAKLLQENAKAQYATEMQLARIQAYKNTAALGYGRLGIQQAGLNLRQQEYADKKAREDKKLKLQEELIGGGQNNNDPLGIR